VGCVLVCVGCGESGESCGEIQCRTPTNTDVGGSVRPRSLEPSTTGEIFGVIGVIFSSKMSEILRKVERKVSLRMDGEYEPYGTTRRFARQMLVHLLGGTTRVG
jgi:hypothetical protein